MCMGGVRSQAAAELIEKKNYKCVNISDGFLGNNEKHRLERKQFTLRVIFFLKLL